MRDGKPDREILHRHLGALRGALAHLRRHAGRTAADLAADADLRWSIERGLQLCAQNILDICTHVTAASGREAIDYAGAIDALGNLGVLPRDFAARLRGIAGFRNVLVHAYLEVDLGIVERVLNHTLDDMEEFADRMERYLAALH